MDLIQVARVRNMLARHGDRALRRFFTPGEIAFCRRTADPPQCFAARLAGKEATFKALATGRAQGVLWRDVEVVRDDPGHPVLRLSGTARACAERLRAHRSWLSLSHERDHACALVVLESPER